MAARHGWFLAGLFQVTLATLTLEILDTRLLSVLTWYHLSFFAVSVAMLGMAAGAVHVYLAGERFAGEAAAAALARFGTLFALSIPLCHLANLVIRIPVKTGVMGLLALGLSTLFLAIPFYLSGVLVAIALTRVPGRIGVIYGVDLLGACLGSLLVLPLLDWGNITSAAFVSGAAAAGGAICFRVFAGRRGLVRDAAVLAVLLALAGLNNAGKPVLRVLYPKGKILPASLVAYEFWSIHGQVVSREPRTGQPFYWGPGLGAGGREVERITLEIDGGASTSMTRFDGNPASVPWVQYDVTALPYHIRKGGDVAVVGIGGGRDVLTALWARSRSVTGIEIQRALIHLLQGPLRDFANLADRSDVTLVHDEARSHLTRTAERFDVLQMSLIDTWAATGAGAYTLSENGLYTLEAWEVFLDRLKPGGILAVSRWYAPGRASETSRLAALATAALLRHGVAAPAEHLALIARERVATLLVSPDPLTRGDLQILGDVSARLGFTILLAPGHPPAERLLGRIVSCRTVDQIHEVVRAEPFDYTPATDKRPFFFNLLKPSKLLAQASELGDAAEEVGVVSGNLVATMTLALLMIVVAALVAVVIFGPLWRTGMPDLDGRGFALAVLYFALIGMGFMLVQIGFMQRFSVYLGHPIYAVAVVLFSMILAAGLGSLISDRIPVERRTAWGRRLPLLTAGVLLAVTLVMQPAIEGTIHRDIVIRALVVFMLVVPVSLLLGTFFPIGMRIVGRLSGDALPWMWGVNGACGVLASVAAVAVSMWSGIPTNFYLAVAAYALIALPATALLRRARA